MKLGSACSGVGCIDLGLERAGFEPAWQIETDPTCRAVLERHWPGVERHEDLTDAAKLDLHRVDLIAGGTPCQDLSVAGKGAGLDGSRSALFYDFVRLADSQPWAFVLWENVPGALSSNEGRDFAVCLEGFTGARFEVPPDGWRGSGVAFGPLRWAVWRVLDAQHFGVAQRRRRVFVVAGPRGRCGPEILFEPESLRGDSAASREALVVDDASLWPEEVLRPHLYGEKLRQAASEEESDEVDRIMACEEGLSAWAVRKVREAERLGRASQGQGLGEQLARELRETLSRLPHPDDHTKYRADGSEIADGPRYRMVGNGAAVPVLEWIGRRIAEAL